MKIAGSMNFLKLAGGAPAGIDELAESRMVAGFSLRARLWHGCTCGCSIVSVTSAVFQCGIPQITLTLAASLGSLKRGPKRNVEPLRQLDQAPV